MSKQNLKCSVVVLHQRTAWGGSVVRGSMKWDPSHILTGQGSSCAWAASYFCLDRFQEMQLEISRITWRGVKTRVTSRVSVCTEAVNNSPCCYNSPLKPLHILAALIETTKGEDIVAPLSCPGVQSHVTVALIFPFVSAGSSPLLLFGKHCAPSSTKEKRPSGLLSFFVCVRGCLSKCQWDCHNWPAGGTPFAKWPAALQEVSCLERCAHRAVVCLA